MTRKNQRDIQLEQLLKKVVGRNEKAQRELYDLLVLRMYNVVYRILKNKEDSEDCLQVGFSSLFAKIDLYDPKKASFNTWATKIFIHKSLSFLRKRKLNFEEIHEYTHMEGEYNVPLNKMNAEYILSQIEKLPDQMRVIFNLYEIEGYSHREIAELLDIGESSSRTYLMRAKVKLRELLEKSKSEFSEYYK